MTGKHPPPIGGRTLADELRDDLKRCEDWVVQIGPGVDGLALLRLIDRVADELERLEERGVDLRPERERLETVLARLRRNAQVLVAQLGSSLATERPAEARWWWYLDEQVVTDRRRRLRQVVVALLAGVGLLVSAYLLYDRILAPPPHIRQANARFYEGERAVVQGDLAQAIEHFEAAATLNPEYAEAHLWLGVLGQRAGDADRSASAFERARALFNSEIHFLLERGFLYLTLDDNVAANQDAQAAIRTFPDRPEGYFLLANVAERTGDLELAAESFQHTVDLAAETGALELEVTARMRLATVVERLLVAPQP